MGEAAGGVVAHSNRPPLSRSNTSPLIRPAHAPVRRRAPRRRPLSDSPHVPPDDVSSSPASIRAHSSGSSLLDAHALPVAVTPPPAWARHILNATSSNTSNSATNPPSIQAIPNQRVRHGDVVRRAIRVLCKHPLDTSLLPDARIPPALVSILKDDRVFASNLDKMATISAVRNLALSHRPSRESLVTSDVLNAIVSVANQSASDSKLQIPLNPNTNNNNSTPRPKLWLNAVCTIADIVSNSQNACARALSSGSLAILATAAAPQEDIHVRVRAARALADIGTWSGPRHAVPIVQTQGVVRSMAAILTEKDDLVSNSLRKAIIIALVSMSMHRTARRILMEQGVGSDITAAAKQASLSGDYDIAARSTFAAGHVSGHSVDEFGFLIITNGNDLVADHEHTHDTDSAFAGSPVTTTSSEKSASLLPLREIDQYTNNSNNERNQSAENPEELSDEDSRSPLMAFSNMTRLAAAGRENANPKLKKSTSQVNRDAEYERIWRDILDNRPESLEREMTGKVRRVQDYKELVKLPVPASIRSELWKKLLGIDKIRAEQPNLYESLCQSVEDVALSDETEHTIDADVTRTMTLHVLFWSGGAQVGVKSLRNILRAYARHQPNIGYCQGMSSVAAVFMMNATDEECAFLMFTAFMEDYQYKKVFAEGFPKMLQWLEELKPLMYHYMPEVWKKLEKENVPLELYADKWLITALSHNFPHRYLLRVWDLMFLGGTPKIILKSCLAVLKTSEKRILSMHFEGIMHFLQRDFSKSETKLLDENNPEPFLELARSFRFDPSLKMPPPSFNAHTQHNNNSGTQQQMTVKERVGSSRSNHSAHPKNINMALTHNDNNNNHATQRGGARRRGGGCLCFGKSNTID